MAESYGSDSVINFHEDAAAEGKSRGDRINSETWEPLEKLAKGEVSSSGEV